MTDIEHGKECDASSISHITLFTLSYLGSLLSARSASVVHPLALPVRRRLAESDRIREEETDDAVVSAPRAAARRRSLSLRSQPHPHALSLSAPPPACRRPRARQPASRRPPACPLPRTSVPPPPSVPEVQTDSRPRILPQRVLLGRLGPPWHNRVAVGREDERREPDRQDRHGAGQGRGCSALRTLPRGLRGVQSKSGLSCGHGADEGG